jgi:hypothetical protein
LLLLLLLETLSWSSLLLLISGNQFSIFSIISGV